MRDVRGVRDVKGVREAVYNEEGLNPIDPDSSDESDDNEVPYAVNELRVINKNSNNVRI